MGNVSHLHVSHHISRNARPWGLEVRFWDHFLEFCYFVSIKSLCTFPLAWLVGHIRGRRVKVAFCEFPVVPAEEQFLT